jgi:hypothetical protein
VCLINRKGEQPRDLPMQFDGDLLVITGPHGFSSWLKRVSIAERPPYLSQFYEPPTNAATPAPEVCPAKPRNEIV